MNLYQPIIFKRAKDTNWETGWKRTNISGETFLEEDRKTVVNQIFKYKISWF
ncbi:hypothetical protein JMF89_13440 [Clostridiaceae bacterium UIB06]|nr:hypothetical protein [Clostridiaceae bacterium UIB06]